MDCHNCGNDVAVRKSLRRGKSEQPETCPDCGASLTEKSDDSTRIEKNV